MKKEALNEKRLHRGSDKPCTVRGALHKNKKNNKKKNWAVMQKVQCLWADLRRITAVNRSKDKQKSNTTIWIEVEDRMIIS